MTDPDDGWYRRRAEQAAGRAADRREIERAESARAWQEMVDTADAQGWARVAGTTLGQAVSARRWVDENGPVWCACVGPPLCCRFSWRQGDALRRAAHIAVRQLSDLADRRAADPSWRAEP